MGARRSPRWNRPWRSKDTKRAAREARGSPGGTHPGGAGGQRRPDGEEAEHARPSQARRGVGLRGEGEGLDKQAIEAGLELALTSYPADSGRSDDACPLAAAGSPRGSCEKHAAALWAGVWKRSRDRRECRSRRLLPGPSLCRMTLREAVGELIAEVGELLCQARPRDLSVPPRGPAGVLDDASEDGCCGRWLAPGSGLWPLPSGLRGRSPDSERGLPVTRGLWPSGQPGLPGHLWVGGMRWSLSK